MKWSSFPSCRLISGLRLPTPTSLPSPSGCLWPPGRALRRAGGRKSCRKGVLAAILRLQVLQLPGPEEALGRKA